MSMSAGLKAAATLELARMVVAVELLCACQAIDLLAPLRTSAPLARAHDFIRTRVPVVDGRPLDVARSRHHYGTDCDGRCRTRVHRESQMKSFVEFI
jgi:hypothetical protein